MDRKITDKRQKQNRNRKALKIVGTITIIISAYLIILNFMEPTISLKSVRVDTVRRSDINQTVSASGVVEAQFNRPILAPSSAIIEQIIAIPGTEVKQGDTILILSRDKIIEQIAVFEEQIVRTENTLDKSLLNSSSDKLSREYDRLVIEGEISALKRQLESEKIMLDLGGIAEEKLLQTEEKLFQAQKKLSVSDKKALISTKLKNLEHQTLRIDIESAKRELEREKQALNSSAVTSPIDGVIISISNKVGEMITADSKLIEVADLSSYKITGMISDSRADKIEVGKRAFIDIDDSKIQGVITNVRPEVDNGKIKFDIKLDNPNQTNIHPNQQVDIDISINHKRDVLIVNNGVFNTGSLNSKVFVINGKQADVRDISIGITNSREVEITKGLQEGDIIIVSDMSRYKNLESIEIK